MTDQSAEGLLSPWLRSKRMQAAEPWLHGRILDFGCGSGALAKQVSSDRYLGIDRDATSLQRAAEHFPHHVFLGELPEEREEFDTVVALAVIEHVDDPARFLQMLSVYLSASPEARLVLTTPHPAVDWVHDAGSAIGLFSRHANEEHEALLDRVRLESAGEQAELELVTYRRFLFGANQLAVYARQVA